MLVKACPDFHSDAENPQDGLQALLEGDSSVRRSAHYGRSSPEVDFIKLLVEKVIGIESWNRGMSPLLTAASSVIEASTKALLDLRKTRYATDSNGDDREMVGARVTTLKKRIRKERKSIASNGYATILLRRGS